MNVKVNDTVVVITGKYAAHKDIPAKQGKVIATSPKNGTVTVEGINIHKKSQKARRANEVSQIVEIPAPIDVSNVMVICSACDKAIRVKHSVIDGKKVRVCPKCGATLDKAYAGKGGKAVKEEPKKRVRKRAKKTEDVETPAETPADGTAE